MRKFHGLIFFGSDKSHGEKTLLHKRFEQAVGIASGLEQPYHPISEKDAEEEAKFIQEQEQELKDIIQDIAAALLGREITFGEELPYPPITPNEGLHKVCVCFEKLGYEWSGIIESVDWEDDIATVCITNDLISDWKSITKQDHQCVQIGLWNIIRHSTYPKFNITSKELKKRLKEVY